MQALTRPAVHRPAKAQDSLQLEEMASGEVPAAGTLVLWNEHLVPEALDDPRPAFMELLPRTGTRAVQVPVTSLLTQHVCASGTLLDNVAPALGLAQCLWCLISWGPRLWSVKDCPSRSWHPAQQR